MPSCPFPTAVLAITTVCRGSFLFSQKVKKKNTKMCTGLSVSSLSRTVMTIDPDTPAAAQLREWYAAEGQDAGFAAVNEGLATALRRDGSGASARSARTPLGDIVKTTNLPPVDAKPEYFNAVVTVAKIQDDQSMYYCACPDNNRKVVETPGGWLCEYDGQTYASMVRRYVLSALIKDHTGRAWVSIFNNDVRMLGWGRFGVA